MNLKDSTIGVETEGKVIFDGSVKTFTETYPSLPASVCMILYKVRFHPWDLVREVGVYVGRMFKVWRLFSHLARYGHYCGK